MWILTSDWIKLRGSHAIHGSYITCCKTSLPWAGKTCNMYRFCRKKKELLSTFCNKFVHPQQPDLLQDRFECGWYINTSLFDLFCTNVPKQDAHFCCRFYHPLSFTSSSRKHPNQPMKGLSRFQWGWQWVLKAKIVNVKLNWSFQKGGEGEKNLHEKVWVFSGMIQSEFEWQY